MKNHPVLLRQPSHEQGSGSDTGKPSRFKSILDFIKRQKSFGSVINHAGADLAVLKGCRKGIVIQLRESQKSSLRESKFL